MTSLVATVGPSMRSTVELHAAIRAGATAFRFSASKFGPAELEAMAADAAAAAELAGRPADLWLDVPGTKTRLTSHLPLDLSALDRVRLLYTADPGAHGAHHEARISDPAFGHRVRLGDILVWGDGEDAGQVVEVADSHCDVEPLTRGVVGPRKGIAIAGSPQPHRALAADDLAALAAVGSSSFTGAIVSFVETPETVETARRLISSSTGTNARAIIAKIETRAGAAAAHEIARSADAVLLGRGDLLLETGELDFHATCTDVIRACRDVGTPLVVGTQLLTSLADSWLPHRSELAYVSSLIEQGVEGLMLAAETTIGPDPVRAISTLAALVSRYGGTPPRPMFVT